MYVARYLLDIEKFMDTENGEALLARAFLCVDEERREKARRMRPGRARAASLGAGLLLQAAVRKVIGAAGVEAPAGRHRAAFDMAEEPEEREQESDEQEPGDGNPGAAEGEGKIERNSVNKLLEFLENKPPIPLAYRYGENGKPYFRELPFYFNLSHSGDYVFCAVSTEEMGADIQQHCGKDIEKLARRFFSGREAAALEQAGADRKGLFYRLWARKEAYGKLTGKGVVWALGVDFLPGEAVSLENGNSSGETYVTPGTDLIGGDMPLPETVSGDNEAWMSETSVLPEGRCLLWEEWCGLEGYSIALCRYGRPGYLS